MQTLLLVTMVGLAGGIAVGFQGPLASVISSRLGVVESVFIVHLGGALAALVPLALLGGGRMNEWRSLPWPVWFAGALGMILIGSISFVIPRQGVVTASALLITGQLAISALLDQFGLLGAEPRPITLSRLAGIAILFLGVWLLTRQNV